MDNGTKNILKENEVKILVNSYRNFNRQKKGGNEIFSIFSKINKINGQYNQKNYFSFSILENEKVIDKDFIELQKEKVLFLKEVINGYLSSSINKELIVENKILIEKKDDKIFYIDLSKSIGYLKIILVNKGNSKTYFFNFDIIKLYNLLNRLDELITTNNFKEELFLVQQWNNKFDFIKSKLSNEIINNNSKYNYSIKSKLNSDISTSLPNIEYGIFGKKNGFFINFRNQILSKEINEKKNFSNDINDIIGNENDEKKDFSYPLMGIFQEKDKNFSFAYPLNEEYLTLIEKFIRKYNKSYDPSSENKIFSINEENLLKNMSFIKEYKNGNIDSLQLMIYGETGTLQIAFNKKTKDIQIRRIGKITSNDLKRLDKKINENGIDLDEKDNLMNFKKNIKVGDNFSTNFINIENIDEFSFYLTLIKSFYNNPLKRDLENLYQNIELFNSILKKENVNIKLKNSIDNILNEISVFINKKNYTTLTKKIQISKDIFIKINLKSFLKLMNNKYLNNDEFLKKVQPLVLLINQDGKELKTNLDIGDIKRIVEKKSFKKKIETNFTTGEGENVSINKSIEFIFNDESISKIIFNDFEKKVNLNENITNINLKQDLLNIITHDLYLGNFYKSIINNIIYFKNKETFNKIK